MEFLYTAPTDQRAAPLLADLLREYTERYGPGASREFERHPADRFLPANGGAFVLGLENGRAIAGGAFMRSEDRVAEVKRMWTHPDHRRRGHAARVLVELEHEAARRGYRRIVLSTGPRQPEAVRLYERLGYGPLDPTVDPTVAGYFAFAKTLSSASPEPRTGPGTGPRLGFFTRLLGDDNPQQRYRRGIEHIVEAERLGFDAAWIAQHHFNGDEGGMPSPLVFLAAVAARTSRIRLGTSIITLPLDLPVRVAEDAAVLDALSGGRVELGVGSGGTPASFAPFGLDASHRRAIHEKNLDLLLSALRGEPLSTTGSGLYPSGRRLLDSFWQATFSAQGAARIGAAGHGLMLSRTQPRAVAGQRLDDVQQPIVDAYLRALPSGVQPRIMASRALFVADDDQLAQTRSLSGIRRWAHAARAAGVDVPDLSPEELLRQYDVHSGTAEDVVASLGSDTALRSATDIVFQPHPIDPPHEEILRSMQLIAERVAPALGWTRRSLP